MQLKPSLTPPKALIHFTCSLTFHIVLHRLYICILLYETFLYACFFNLLPLKCQKEDNESGVLIQKKVKMMALVSHYQSL